MSLEGYGPEEEALGKAYDARLIRRLSVFLKPYRHHIILAIIFLVIASAAQLAGPYLTKLAIDQHITCRKYLQTTFLQERRGMNMLPDQ